MPKRPRSTRLRNPLEQGIVLLALSAFASLAAVAFVAFGRSRAAGGALILAAVGMVFFAALVLASRQRLQKVEDHLGQRRVSQSMVRERARMRLQAGLLELVVAVDYGRSERSGELQRAFSALVDESLAMLGSGDAGVAVSLFFEADRRRQVLRSAATRMDLDPSLLATERVAPQRPLQELLPLLASHWRTLSAATTSGRLTLAILSETSLAAGDEAFMGELDGYLTVIATRVAVPPTFSPGRPPRLVWSGGSA